MFGLTSAKKAEVQLGDKVKDRITGFEGIVVAITTWMYGCRRVTVLPDRLDKDGKILDSASFDEPQIEILKAANTPPEVEEERRLTGGPRPEPDRGR